MIHVLPSRLPTLPPEGAEREFSLTHDGIALFWLGQERFFAKESLFLILFCCTPVFTLDKGGTISLVYR